MYYGDGENCKSYSEMEVSSSGGGGGGDGEYKTTESLRKGQQTEESYQLQLALAVRLSAQASCGHDPNFLVSSSHHHHHHHHRGTLLSSVSAEALSHRFWVGINAIFASLSVNGCNFCYRVLLAYVIRHRI